MKFNFYSFSILIFIFLTFVKLSYASDFSMRCDESKCTPSSIAKFFDEKVLWYPTYSKTNTVTVTNESKMSKFIGHGAANIKVSSGTNVADALVLEIVRKSTNKSVWKSTLQQFYNTQENVLGTLGPGKTDSFDYTITMLDVGNEYQGKSTQFDLVFGFFVPTETPKPTFSPTLTLINSSISNSIQDGSNTNSQNDGEVQGASDRRNRPSILENIQIKFSEIKDAIGQNKDIETQDKYSKVNSAPNPVPLKKSKLSEKFPINFGVIFVALIIFGVSLFILCYFILKKTMRSSNSELIGD